MRFKRAPRCTACGEQARDSLTRCALPRSGWQARPRREDARITDGRVSGYTGGLRNGGEDLEPRVKAGKSKNGRHQGRGGGQAQDTAQQAGAAGDANQHGKPLASQKVTPDRSMTSRLHQGRSRPRSCSRNSGARDADFTADRHDGVSILTADGKHSGRRDMIDFARRCHRPPISVPAEAGCGAPRTALT
jgi:hypothetical protein